MIYLFSQGPRYLRHNIESELVFPLLSNDLLFCTFGTSPDRKISDKNGNKTRKHKMAFKTYLKLQMWRLIFIWYNWWRSLERNETDNLIITEVLTLCLQITDKLFCPALFYSASSQLSGWTRNLTPLRWMYTFFPLSW